MTVERLEITEYNLYDFAKAIEQGVLMGFEISDTNEDAPVQLGFVYYCGMVRPVADLGDDEAIAEIMDTLQPETEQLIEALLNTEVDDSLTGPTEVVPKDVVEEQPFPTLATGIVVPVTKAKRGAK